MKNKNDISRKAGLGIISFIFVFYFIFKFNPELKFFINALVRYLFVFGAIGTLSMLSLHTMYQMYQEKEKYALIRSCFGIVSAILISLITENSINQTVIDFIKATYNPIAYYSGAIFIGIFTCSIGAKLINPSKPLHTKPVLVFACCTVACLIFQVTTVPYINIDITLLLTYFLGITFYPLIFRNFGVRNNSQDAKPVKNAALADSNDDGEDENGEDENGEDENGEDEDKELLEELLDDKEK